MVPQVILADRATAEATAARRARLGMAAARRVVRPPARAPDLSKPYVRPLERERPKKAPIDFEKAVELVVAETGVPRRLLLTDNRYSLALGARSFLWCILFDGGWEYSKIAVKFNTITPDVKVAVLGFRAFQAEKAMAE